jgi:prepilin-type N-terminal cleavage/methylation domain-containing protein
MKLNRKINAFTLTEMLIVLAISTIVAGLAFTIISLLERNVQIIQNNFSETTEIKLLEDRLLIDFNRYHTLHYENDKETLTISTPIESVTYNFNELYILREFDTILSVPYSKQMYYQGNEVNSGAVDAVKIQIAERKNLNSIFVNKENDAYNLMQNGN